MIENAANPLVSVWMITYNHEKYIEEAIESVLAQKTNFNFELVIGEDNSTDNTAQIIKNYQTKYPNIVKVVFNKPNLGVMQNMIQTMKRCKGQYVAMLEGDDYWINENKLQTQVDVLRENKSISFCFHNAIVKYENDNTKSYKFAELEQREYLGKEILKNWIVPTASVVFRNNGIKFPEFALKCVHGDILLFLLIIENGPAYALTEQWSVYRKNQDGVTLSNQSNGSYINKVLYQNKKMNQFFNYKYSDVFIIHKQYWSLALLKTLWINNKISSFILEFVSFNLSFPFYFVRKYLIKSK